MWVHDLIVEREVVVLQPFTNPVHRAGQPTRRISANSFNKWETGMCKSSVLGRSSMRCPNLWSKAAVRKKLSLNVITATSQARFRARTSQRLIKGSRRGGRNKDDQLFTALREVPVYLTSIVCLRQHNEAGCYLRTEFHTLQYSAYYSTICAQMCLEPRSAPRCVLAATNNIEGKLPLLLKHSLYIYHTSLQMYCSSTQASSAMT